VSIELAALCIPKTGYDSQINDNNYGHSGAMAIMQQRFGLAAAPLILLYGPVYELIHFVLIGGQGNMRTLEGDHIKSGIYDLDDATRRRLAPATK
jgi:hypothetical protein